MNITFTEEEANQLLITVISKEDKMKAELKKNKSAQKRIVEITGILSTLKTIENKLTAAGAMTKL